MFLYSEIHDWQGDAAVKQILVFSNKDLKEHCERSIARRIAQEGIEKASDNNIGAIYKLRAVKNGEGQWEPTIRCGFTGVWLWGGDPWDTPEGALIECSNKLVGSIAETAMEVLKLTQKVQNAEQEKTA